MSGRGLAIVPLGALLALCSAQISTSAAAAPKSEAVAFAARSLRLQESASMSATSKHGFTLNERGSVAGTVNGTIYVHLTVVSTSRVIAEVNMYTSGGSISGNATASYRKGSQTGTFAGTVSIDRGTGTYARVRGSGLSFSGTIKRSNDAVTVHMSGTVSD